MLRLISLCVLVAGCGNDLPVSSFVEKIRVLAVRAEPPEAQPNSSSRHLWIEAGRIPNKVPTVKSRLGCVWGNGWLS